MYKHILLPTDGSKLSMQAAKLGIELAQSVGARITVFYANPGIGIEYYAADAPMPQEVFDSEKARLAKQADKYLAAVRTLAEKARVEVATYCVEDRMAAEAIIHAAKRKRCDLIVMASHGRSGLGRVLLGSVANRVLTHSRIPVLICRSE